MRCCRWRPLPISSSQEIKAHSLPLHFHTHSAVNSKARSLGPGTYTDNIGFNNTTNNQGNTTRVATLIVNPKPYRLSVSASPATYGTVSGGGTFAEGSSVTVTATPTGSHSFVNWTQNTKVVSTSANYTFTMPSANVTLVAHFT